MKFTKTPKTYEEQIALLESRGLSVPDHPQATHYLSHISYYRLSAYAIPFHQRKDVFKTGVSFNDLIDLYVFDRELRLLVLEAIERIEVAIRAQMIYQLCHKYGSHWPDDCGIFVPPYTNRRGLAIDEFAKTQAELQKHYLAATPEVFIQHYRTTYSQPPTPPAWMSIELLTIGQLSSLYSGLASNKDKNDIAMYFGLSDIVFQSWFHALAYVRNICPHHARLWNRDLAVQPSIPRKEPALPWIGFRMSNRRCFFFLCVLKYFLHTVNPGGHLRSRLLGLFEDHPNVPIRVLGIPSDTKGDLVNWQTEPLWS